MTSSFLLQRFPQLSDFCRNKAKSFRSSFFERQARHSPPMDRLTIASFACPPHPPSPVGILVMKLYSLLAVCFVGIATLAQAGAIRHDRDDSLYLSLAASPGYSTVGQFIGTTTSSSYYGSGTLIAPNWILTAGHVVDQATSLSFNIGGASYTASNWVSHPSWNGDLSTGYDIGLVQLSSSIAGITPAARYTNSNEIGALATSVGFGKTGTGLTGAIAFDGKKRAGQNVVDKFYSSQNNRILLSDFDNPTNAADNAFGSSIAGNLEYLIAPGDSGGGLFVDFGQGPLLAGVHSFGSAIDGLVDSDYGDRSGHTRVSVFNSWIDSMLGIGGGTSGSGGANRGGKKKFSGEFGGPIAGVPEPSSLMLLLVGVGAMRLNRRRR